MLYFWIKALHIISVIAWMAGLLYLPRLFVNHVGLAPGSEASDMLKGMESRLLRIIMRPAAAGAMIFGIAMLFLPQSPVDWSQGWIYVKLAFVAGLGFSQGKMERWTKDFDNWGVCDTLCFKLYDRSPLAWKKVAPWARKKDEFVRRAAFALLASLALHDKAAKDEAFVKTLPLIEKAAVDERNFVKTGVSWALRSVGRRNAALRARSVALAKRLAACDDPAPRWIGKDALRDLTR